MKNYPYIGGVAVSKIQNREFIRLETDKAQAIVVALDKSNIPFSARFSDTEMVLTYDGSFKEQIKEIIAKAKSGDYEILLRELQVYGVPDGYYRLLGEVAELLNTTTGALKNRPDEIQLALCKTYTDFWLCDDATIQRELDRIITVNGRTLQDIQEHEKTKIYRLLNTEITLILREKITGIWLKWHDRKTNRNGSLNQQDQKGEDEFYARTG